MQNWHQNLDHWLAFDQSLQAHEKGEKGCHFHFVKSLDQFFLDWFSIARSSSWLRPTISLSSLVGLERGNGGIGERSKTRRKTKLTIIIASGVFQFFFFSILLFFYFSISRRKTRPKAKRTIIFAGYFSSAHVEWYRISDQSGPAPLVFYVSSPIVFRISSTDCI